MCIRDRVGTLRFVDRHNDGDTHVVVLRYAALFYWAYWPTLLATACAFIFTSTATTVVAIVAWSLLMLTAIPYWPVVFELKRRMRSGPITASGSKYSLANPLTAHFDVPHGQAIAVMLPHVIRFNAQSAGQHSEIDEEQ